MSSTRIVRWVRAQGQDLVLGLLSAILLMASIACSEGSKSTGSPAVSPGIPGLPVSLHVGQRSTTPIPGTRDSLFLTIDDITRGQVMTTLMRGDKSPLVGPLSLTPHATMAFEYDHKTYVLELVDLDNALLGRDFATFMLSDRSVSEAARIDGLLTHVAALTDVRFVRHGTEYASAEAVAHLRRKLDAVNDSNMTAEQFIDQLASRSSLTGDEYEIRLADGTTLKAAEYFRRELTRIESRSLATTR